MKICFLGDSITQGAGATDYPHTFVSLVGERLGCEARNFGIGGTRIARQTRPSEMTWLDLDFNLRAEVMDADADFVFVFGGTNDFGAGDAAMGDLDSHDVYTFCGAINVLSEFLIRRYGREKICFIVPIPRAEMFSRFGNGKSAETHPLSLYTMQEYIECMKAVLEKQGIAVIDLTPLFPIPQRREKSEYYMDGLHPNDLGHSIIADEICAWVRARM